MFDIASLRMASFNGLPFWVQTSDVEAGHRVKTTLVPNGTHINESFGPSARKFEVEAYCIGANLPSAAGLLTMAESQHLGVLVLPDTGGQMVRLIKAKRKFDKDKLGYVVVSIEAVAEPSSVQAGFSANVLAQQVFSLAASAVAASGSFAARAFALAGANAPVVESAIEAGAAVFGDLAALRDASRLAPSELAQIAAPFDAAFEALTVLPQNPAGFGEAIALAAIALGDVVNPAGFSALIEAAGPVPSPPPANASRGSAVAVAAIALSGSSLSSAMRALALGEAMTRREFADRPEAVRARALAVAVFDDALARLGRDGIALAQLLRGMSGVLAEMVTRRAADLAQIITVSVGAKLPALWWSWRLYGTPDRADEVAKRAGAWHHGALPLRFNVLAA